MKSDDINGRRRAYEAIIKGQNIPKPGVPESFKVLVKELQALALDVRVLDENGEEIKLSTLCNEEDVNSAFANRADVAAIEAALGQEELLESDLQDMTIEDENGEVVLPDEDGDDSYDDDDNV